MHTQCNIFSVLVIILGTGSLSRACDELTKDGPTAPVIHVQSVLHGSMAPHLPVQSNAWAMPVVAWGTTQEDGVSYSCLGVNLDTPGPALDKQLRLNNKGLIVKNVCRDCPADLAGLQQYDVIVRFDNQDVSNDPQQLAEAIRNSSSGKQIEFTILREGQEVSLSAMLAICPIQSEWEWKYETEPDQVYRSQFQVLGKIAQMGDDGQVVIEDLGDLHELPDMLRQLVPVVEESQIELWNTDGGESNRLVFQKDGAHIEVFEDQEQRVHVKKIEEGDSDVAAHEMIYESQDQFAAQDPETWKLAQESRVMIAPMASSNKAIVVPIPPRAPNAPHAWGQQVSTAEERRARMLEWRAAWQAQREQVENQLADQLSELAEQQHQVIAQKIRSKADAIQQSLQTADRPAGKKYLFRMQPDGQITVTICQEDQEMILEFRNLDELRNKNQQLFDRFEQLQSSE